MNWNDLKYYLTVARVNSITEAGVELGVSPSTVARRISELESRLGTSLFNKRSTGYFLSEAGKGIFSVVDETEANFQFLERKLANFSDAKARPVKIELPELLGQYVIIPELLALRRSEPGIRFEIVNSVKNSKLSSRGSDIVVRLSMPKSGSYTTRRIGIISQAAYCSQAYLKEQGRPSSTRDSVNHTLIGWNEGMRNLPLAKWFSELTAGSDLWLETSNFNLQLESVCAGIGIAALPKFVAEKFGLKRVFEDYQPLTSDIWLMRSIETSSFEHVDIVLKHIENIIKSKNEEIAFE
uniref:LysR family transcriptional regulator n=1 Tax=OCS116 cluster bacterium TaxID=2030921 RepID=A0A2A4YSQ0_9PROT